MSDEITEDIILDEEPEVSESSDIDFPDKLIKVRFVHSNESAMCVYPEDFDVADKDYAIVDGKYGKDLAQVKGGIYSVSERGKPKHVREGYRGRYEAVRDKLREGERGFQDLRPEDCRPQAGDEAGFCPLPSG